MRCPTCHVDGLAPGSRFCRSCGNALHPQGSAPEPTGELTSEHAQLVQTPPESPSRDATANGGHPSWAARVVLGLIGLLVVAGVIAAIVISGGDGGNSDQASNSDTAVTEESAGPEFTKHSACALEVNVGLDIVLNSGYDSQGLAQVVGSQNAQYPLYTQMVQPFVNYQTQYGRSGAADRIGADVAMACTEAGDPVLTQGQVADMTRLDAIEPSDAQALRRIDYFE